MRNTDPFYDDHNRLTFFQIKLKMDLRNFPIQRFMMTEVSKVSDAVNISRRLLRWNPKNGAQFFLLFFQQSNYAKQRVSFLNASRFVPRECRTKIPWKICSIVTSKLASTNASKQTTNRVLDKFKISQIWRPKEFFFSKENCLIVARLS